MSHDLSSAHIALATVGQGSSRDAGGDITHSRSRSSSTSDNSRDEHQPGISPPLGPDAVENVDLEGKAAPVGTSSFGMTMVPIPPAARLSDPQAGGSLDRKQPAIIAVESATSPLHVDTIHIPSAGPVPYRQSPDGAFAMGNSYALDYITPANEESDPLLLRSKVVDADQVLRRRPSHSRKGDKKVKRYYEKQNALIENLLKPIAKHALEDEDETEKAGSMVKFLIYANIGANFVLAALQLYAAISSLSLSLFATAADSVFDPFANVLLNWLHRKSKNLDKRKWPAGGSRLTNAGNIAYAGIMGSVSVLLIVESARDIASHKPTDVETLHVPALIAVGVAFVTKLVLGIFNYMYRKHSSQLDMLWEDCRNDLFINGFGIFTSAAGAKIIWWLDPAGAMFISFGIIIAWTSTAYKQFKELCGVAAPTEFLQLATYNALHIHYQHIESIESVIAYHSGPRYIVEVDIVMRPDTPLWKSHDVSQDLQDKLEQLPMVERAYIHVDFDVHHEPEHQSSKKVK